MEPLRLLLGLLFAMMSVGVLVFPAAWPFSKGEAPRVPDTNIPLAEPVISLAEIPTDTVLTVQPLTVQPIIVQPTAPSKALADQLSMAKYFAAEKQFDEALDVLAALPVQDQDQYEVVYLRARILAWSGRHLAAEQKFQRLMSKYPEDTDVMLSYGYLQFYQGKSAEAEKAFLGVLAINPDYKDAQDGLTRARKAL